jgi:hypothetical protein
VGVPIILVGTILIVVLSPFEMGYLAGFRHDWDILGNIGQAYGGASAILSAIALIGVAGSLLLQTRQHSIDRMTAVRTQQGRIYDVVREDPALYWPAVGGHYDNDRSVRQRIMRIESLRYILAGYETGYIPEANLRSEFFPGFFTYEENRKSWDAIRPTWAEWVEDIQSKKHKKFVSIADQELARARAAGPGIPFPQSADLNRRAFDELAKWRLPIVAGAAAAALTFLLTRRLRS